MSCDHSHPWLVTYLPDGHALHAHPAIGADVVEQLHDVCHLVLAKALGAPSGALERAAGGYGGSDHLIALEEAAVLHLQEYVRGLADSNSESLLSKVSER